MKNLLKSCLAIALIFCTSMFVACSSDDNDGNKEDSWQDQSRKAVIVDKKNDVALLLCSFGSTYPQPQATYEKIVADYKAAYPNTDIYLSFTSRTIVSRVYNQLGKAYAQPDLWLSAIGKAGYKTVYVQSLHIIPGEEYLSLMNTDVKKNFMVPFPDVRVAKSSCLLETEDDVTNVAKILYDYYKPRLDKGEVVAFMGHGNPDVEYNHANERYDQLETALQGLSGQKNIFVGTVDWGEKMFSHIREELKDFATRNNKENKDVVVNLTPLMSIAGDHAQVDLLGGLKDGQSLASVDPYEKDSDAEYSWILKLEKLGFTISPDGSLTGTDNFNVVGVADNAEIRKIWTNHMTEAIKNAISWNEHLGD